ncbi:acyl-CoA dehydrogenase family protein [Streptomyces fractus]|uniref:acyl-CoA dehydrogenase family protein n=1 Tax=Streptomyces fractus TaxID=641806 RepID=UPI003CEF1B81
MSNMAEELRDLADDLVRRIGSGDSAEEQRELWRQTCELGLHRIGIDEEQGGSGGAFEDLTVLAEAFGRNGVSLPLIESATAEWALSHSAVLNDGGTTVLLQERPLDSSAGVLTAQLTAVPWAGDSESLLVYSPDTAPILVDLGHPSVTVSRGKNLAGEARDTVDLDGTPVQTLVGAPDFTLMRARLAVLWSAAVTGASHGALDLTKSYVAERTQFGGPLLKIPAVAGNLALMRVEVVQADAALALACSLGSTALAAETARLTTTTTATAVARIAHQLNGALGITQEYALHRFTRRLWAWRDAVGSERHWSHELGRRAAALGEEEIWELLTPA